MGNQGGNCSRIAPSLPAWRSGSRAARNRSQAWSVTAGSTSFRYTRSLAAPSEATASRRSAGSALTGVGCWVNRLNALTLKVNPAGVRSAQDAAVCSAGSA